YDPGGKGINISRVLWELGERSLLFGFLGGEAGKRVEKYLEDEGLVVDFNWTAGETRENLILTVEGTLDQTKVNLPGPPIREDELHRLKRKIAGRAADSEILALSGSVPPRALDGQAPAMRGAQHRRRRRLAARRLPVQAGPRRSPRGGPAVGHRLGDGLRGLGGQRGRAPGRHQALLAAGPAGVAADQG